MAAGLDERLQQKVQILQILKDTEEVEISVHVPSDTAKTDIKAGLSNQFLVVAILLRCWWRFSSSRSHSKQASARNCATAVFDCAVTKVLHCGKMLVEGALAAPCCPEGRNLENSREREHTCFHGC